MEISDLVFTVPPLLDSAAVQFPRLPVPSMIVAAVAVERVQLIDTTDFVRASDGSTFDAGPTVICARGAAPFSILR